MSLKSKSLLEVLLNSGYLNRDSEILGATLYNLLTICEKHKVKFTKAEVAAIEEPLMTFVAMPDEPEPLDKP